MEFHKWSENDRLEIFQLEKDIFSDSWSLYAIDESINCPAFVGYILTDEGETVGYYGFYAIPPEGHIANVAVVEKHRGKKYGIELLNHMIRTGDLCEILDYTLEVRVSNEPAINLYKKLGFKQEGLRKKFYDDGEDAIIMWRRNE